MPKPSEDSYEMFGVGLGASFDTIKDAYRDMVRKCHPDKLVNTTAEEHLAGEENSKCLNNAYEVLSDPAARAAYDLARPQHPPPQAGRPHMGKPTRLRPTQPSWRQYTSRFNAPTAHSEPQAISFRYIPSWS